VRNCAEPGTRFPNLRKKIQATFFTLDYLHSNLQKEDLKIIIAGNRKWLSEAKLKTRSNASRQK